MEEDNYNYITATYYLLAERLLKRNLIDSDGKYSKKMKVKKDFDGTDEILNPVIVRPKAPDLIEQVDHSNDDDNELLTNDNASANRRREFLPFAIPEEIEENFNENNSSSNVVFKYVV